MVKVIVRPNRVAFVHNVRWREGEEVELADSQLKNKKIPKWAIQAGTAEAKAAIEEIKNRSRDRVGKTYAPSSLIEKPVAQPQ